MNFDESEDTIMMTWQLKACPRCHGDTYINKGEYNTWYQACLQCGYEGELRPLQASATHEQPTVPQHEKVLTAG